MKKLNIKGFFYRNFSFESGINLNDETEVLYRRNIVIKNIIFLSNLVYSLILFLITVIGQRGGVQWLWSILPVPITFALNQTIKKIISKTDDKNAQVFGSYLCCFSAILSAFLVYIKIAMSVNTEYLKDSAYLLIYYSLIIVSFYQDPKIIRNLFGWVLGGITIVHFLVTRPIQQFYSDSLIDFLSNHFMTDYWSSFVDIIFRSFVLALIMTVIIIITNINAKINEQRKTELTKRKDIQNDFTTVVTDLYNVILSSKVNFDIEERYMPIVADIAKELASYMGLGSDTVNEVYDFAMYTVNHQMDIDINDGTEERFYELRNQTEIGAMIAKRLQLALNAETLVRATIEDWSNKEFQIKMVNMIENIESQIILLSDIYVTMRAPKRYKRPYPHAVLMQQLQERFGVYFNPTLIERFIQFNKKFEEMYNNFNNN